jgi:hypothetical protein
VRHLRIATIALVMASPGFTTAALAQPAASSLTTCLADHTTGKDRKDLARWMFAAMSQHPAIADLSAATPAARDDASRTVGALVTRLLTVDCLPDTKAAVESGETSAVFQKAFGRLGELAMQEIMADPQVSKTLQDLPKYMDRKQFEAALKAK